MPTEIMGRLSQAINGIANNAYVDAKRFGEPAVFLKKGYRMPPHRAEGIIEATLFRSAIDLFIDGESDSRFGSSAPSSICEPCLETIFEGCDFNHKTPIDQVMRAVGIVDESMTIRRADLERALGRSPKHARTSRAAERAGLLVLRPDGLLEITPLAASILEWHEKGMHTTRQCIEWWWFQDDSDGDGYITLSDCADHLKVRVKSLRRVGAFILSTRQLLLTNVISVDDGDVKVHAA